MKAARQVDLPGQFNEIVDNVRLDSDYNEKNDRGQFHTPR